MSDPGLLRGPNSVSVCCVPNPELLYENPPCVRKWTAVISPGYQ